MDKMELLIEEMGNTEIARQLGKQCCNFQKALYDAEELDGSADDTVREALIRLSAILKVYTAAHKINDDYLNARADWIIENAYREAQDKKLKRIYKK